MKDNWWPAVRYIINDYEEFQNTFKAKYWSESIQNVAHDRLCNVKFNPSRGQTPTGYFFGKICVARHLKPKIPEECLVTKLAYHFGQDIVHARLCNQIKTISGMQALLENQEHESHYRRNQQYQER